MSVAFDALAPSSTTQVSTTSTVTWTHTAGAGANCVLVWVSASDANTPGTMTCKYGGVSMTLLSSTPSGYSADDAGSIYCFGLTTGSAGANTVTATYSRTPSKALLGVSESFTGGASFGTPVTAGTAGANKTSGTVVMSSTTSGGMICGGVCTGSSFTAFSGPTGFTQRWKENHDSSTGAGCTAGCTVASTGSSMTIGWTQSSDIYGAIGVEVKPSSGGSTESGPLAIALPKPVLSLSASVIRSGNFTPVLPKPSVSITSRKVISGAFNPVLPKPTVSITSRKVISGSFSIVLPSPVVSIASTSSRTISGAFNIGLPAPSVALSSSVIRSGAFNPVLPKPAVAITSRKVTGGSFNLELPVPTVSIASNKLVSGSFSLVLPAPVTSLSASILSPGTQVLSLLSHTTGGGTIDSYTGTQVMGVKFAVSSSVNFTGFWFYSASGATQLPSEVGLFDSSGSLVFSNTSPSWSGAAGSGWVRCAASQVIASGTYMAAVWNGAAGGKEWYSITSGAWGPVTNGVLSSAANADYYSDTSTFVNPSTAFSGYNTWIDVEVTASSTESGSLNIQLPLPDISLSASVIRSGSFNIELPVPSVEIASRKLISGDFNLELPAQNASITSRKLISGDFNLELSVPNVEIASRKLISGDFNLELPVPVVSIFSGEHGVIYGTLNILLPAVKVDLASLTWHVASDTSDTSVTSLVNGGSMVPVSSVSGGNVSMPDSGAAIVVPDAESGVVTPASYVSSGTIQPLDTGGSASGPDTGASLSTVVIRGLREVPSATSGDIAPSVTSGGAVETGGEASGGIVSSPDTGAALVFAYTGGGEVTPASVASGGSVQAQDTGGSASSNSTGATEIGPIMQQTAITLNEYDDQTFNVTLTLNGSAENLTGCTVNMILKTAAGVSDTDESSLTLSSAGESPAITVTNASTGACTVTIPRTDLQSTSYGFYKIVVIDASDLQTTYVYGNIIWVKL